MITFDAADFYPENTVTVKKWFAETSRKICYAGPLIPSGEQATAAEQRSSQDGDSIVSFLDKNLASRGERSVIYVGTYEVLIHALFAQSAFRSPLGLCFGLRTQPRCGQSSTSSWRRRYPSCVPQIPPYFEGGGGG